MSVPLKEKETEKEHSGETESEYSQTPIAPSAEEAPPNAERISPDPLNGIYDQEITKRDREILEALDEVIRRNSESHGAKPLARKNGKKAKKFLVLTAQKGVGVVTLALTLISLGITALCVLISDSGNYALIARLSPVAAVFLGVELLISRFMPGKAIRVNLPCTAATAAVVVLCCVLSASLNSSYIKIKEQNDEKHAASEIYEKSYTTLRHTADIQTLSVDVTDLGDTSADSAQGESVDITIVFDGSYRTPTEFAQECRQVMDAYDGMGITVMNYRFSAETRLASFRLDIEGFFMQDSTAAELAELVNYYYIEDYDYISDLDDITEQSSSEETSEAASEDENQ